MGQERLKTRDELAREVEALRERISALTAAILRISASLDVATVVREIAEAARALTHARYAIITTIDDTGQPDDVVFSGFTHEEQRMVEQWTDNVRVLEVLRDLPSPLRVPDMPAYVRALGYSTDGVCIKAFQGTPMRHRGALVGTFLLGEKETGPEFTDEDEEAMALFASQAAAAIVNARTHRDERRVRSDLEALIEISPVGVAVFDARTGHPVSVNRESRRLVEGLRTPGRPIEELLGVMTVRRGDGREVSLSETPVAELLSAGETVRAEEIELSVPDGRSVTMLINLTPIRDEDGAVASGVVTIQDLAPLEALDRQRAEFLGLVSHELRTPLAAIKGSTACLMAAAPSLDPAEAHEFFRIIDEQADHMRGLIVDLLDAGRIDAGTLSVAPVPAEVAGLVEQARSAFLGSGGAHAIVVDLPRDLPRVLADGQRIVQVLNNLFANAALHSPVSAPIRVAAAREGPHVAVSVTDEGEGVAAERLAHLFRKHSGAGDGKRGGLRGSGLGLAICKGLVEAHGGRIRAASGGPGQGTRLTFTVPVAEEAGAAAVPARDLFGPASEAEAPARRAGGGRRPAHAALRARGA